MDRYRQRAVERLLLQSGNTVIDVACGTGANFSALSRYIGPRGRIVGIDVSPDMLDGARRRVEELQLDNVELIEARVDEADVPVAVDAALFSFTHDVLQSPDAVANVVGQVRAAGRVGAVGAKWAPGWRLPVNAYVWLKSRPYVTTLEGFDRPWQHLGRQIHDLSIESVALGGAYIASGTVPPAEDGGLVAA